MWYVVCGKRYAVRGAWCVVRGTWKEKNILIKEEILAYQVVYSSPISYLGALAFESLVPRATNHVPLLQKGNSRGITSVATIQTMMLSGAPTLV